MFHKFQFHVLLCSLILGTGASLVPAADIAIDELPPAADREIDFDADIEPIFQKRCYACHGDDVEMNGYSLWRKKEAMLGGYSGQPAILAGDSEHSRLIHLVAGLEKNLVMPPAGGKLTSEEISVLRAWIDQGVKWANDPDRERRRAEETQWLEMDYGPVISAAITVREPEDPRADKGPDDNISYKSHAVRLPIDSDHGAAKGGIIFDTELLRYSAGWNGGFLNLKGTVYDWSHGPHPFIDGKPIFETPVAPGWARDGSFTDPREEGFGPLPAEWAKYRGRYVHGKKTILSYTVAETGVLDLPGWLESEGLEIITRTLEIEPSKRDLHLEVAANTAGEARAVALGDLTPSEGAARETIAVLGKTMPSVAGVVGAGGSARWVFDDANHIRLRLPPSNETRRLTLLYAKVGEDQIAAFARAVRLAPKPEELKPYTRGGPTRFPETIELAGKLGRASDTYAIDEITLPFENPWKSWIRPGDFAFFSDDRAALSTWSGDIWIVDGVDDDLDKLTWKRYATGFHMPMGLEVVDDVLHVLDRDQITRLHDLNGDGEPDFYENFNNDFHVTHHFHEFTLDLDRDHEGNFIFAKAARHALPAKVKHHGTIMKVDPEGKNLEIVCTGFRVPNGVAVGPNGEITTSDQEGHWIPSTRINWCSPGSYHGYKWGGSIPDREDYDNPITFLPINFDNSGAGQAWVPSDRWGPFKGHLVHTSFGRGKVYLVLMERVGGEIQGGAVEFPVLTNTGLMRPDFREKDGQLYLTGLWGWGTKRPDAGGFYRMRYTGKPVYMPAALKVNKTGIAVTFTQPLDRASVEDLANYTLRRWNYKWTTRYGSDLFKLNGELGTEEVTLKAASLSKDGKTILLKVDDLKEVMQMQLNFSLKAADGTSLKQVLYHTINTLSNKAGTPVTATFR